MRFSSGRQEADEKRPVAPPDRNCAVNCAGKHGQGEGVEAEVENEPQPHNRHCYGGYEKAQSLDCSDEVAAFEEIEEGAGKESEGASGHVDEPGDAPGDCGRFLGEEEEPDQEDDREGDGGDKDGPPAGKGEEAFQPLLMLLTPYDTAVLEVQVSEFMGGELQSDLKKTEVRQHGERGETRHGEPVPLLFLGQKERDQDEGENTRKPAP